MARSRKDERRGATEPIPAEGLTGRQELALMLREREWSFEELRFELERGVNELESDLQHVARSLRRGAERLVVEPPRCTACDFAFRDRAPKRFHTPSRCPLCKSERISPARLRVG